MSGLQTFRSRLGNLKHRRAFTRWQTAFARSIVLVVIALFALLLIDFAFRLETVPRLIAMMFIVGALAWRALRHILPGISIEETVVDVALQLERTHGVDSDLVAALQFDASGNRSVGSITLQRAVVERTAKISETLDLRSAVPRKDARRATWLAVIAVLSASIYCLSFPGHANAFWNRMWLGTATYPTRTIIQDVMVNGRSDAARVVEGEVVEFVVKCSGITPNEGKATLRGVETGDSTTVMLKRADESSNLAVYKTDGPPLNEPVEFTILIGDAKTAPRRVEIIRRPLVELTIEAVAPAYMQRDNIRQHDHYVQVMEGSEVDLSLRCTNGKRLTEVHFELVTDSDNSTKSKTIAFTPTDAARTTWHLDAATSALTRIAKDLQFRIAVIDEDGLATYHPIEGAVRVKRDRGPAATVTSLHHAIMPNARPTVTVTAEDDFGIGAITLHARRAENRDPAADEEKAVSIRIPLEDTDQPLGARVVQAEQLLDPSPLRLAERDKVLVWIEVVDYRGEWPGVSAVSDSIELEVMDERGVLDA
ncbi:MAG: hypothetical protein HYV60_05410, partial [Planctomycetia bacterium]|nr:hypothetical protein [Planctomycetia bacterium]